MLGIEVSCHEKVWLSILGHIEICVNILVRIFSVLEIDAVLSELCVLGYGPASIKVSSSCISFMCRDLIVGTVSYADTEALVCQMCRQKRK